MKCPKCDAKIDHVIVYSECYQFGELEEGNKIQSYGSVEEITETKSINCPKCGEDITNYIKQ